jgi:hypothetical protein
MPLKMSHSIRANFRRSEPDLLNFSLNNSPSGGNRGAMHYDRISGPSAKAYRLLDKIDLGPDLGRSGDGPHLQLREGGGNQFDYSLHAHASDMLALSLLQARLIDLQLPIKIEEWKYR